MKTFSRIQRPRLSELVADEIEEAILTGMFPVGGSLPAEQRLADDFGVSRNVVREALKFLKERGLIEILNGSGAYVTAPSTETTRRALARYLRQIGATSSAEALYEARRILEGANARLAAERATDEDLETLSRCLERMENSRASVEEWAAADLDYHLAVAHATHNPFLSVLLNPLVGQLRDVIIEGYQVPGAVDRGLDAHTRVFDAIRARDPERAWDAIMDHLRDSESRVLDVIKGTAERARSS